MYNGTGIAFIKAPLRLPQYLSHCASGCGCIAPRQSAHAKAAGDEFEKLPRTRVPACIDIIREEEFMSRKKSGRQVKTALSWSALPLAVASVFGIFRMTKRNGKDHNGLLKAGEKLSQISHDTTDELHRLIDDIKQEAEPVHAEEKIDEAVARAKHRLDDIADTLKKGVKKAKKEEKKVPEKMRETEMRSGSNIPGMHYGRKT
jgi:hypothetical protein